MLYSLTYEIIKTKVKSIKFYDRYIDESGFAIPLSKEGTYFTPVGYQHLCKVFQPALFTNHVLKEQ